MDKETKMNLSISFGGTKVAIAIVSSISQIMKTPRIEWRNHSMYCPNRPLESLLNLVVHQVWELLQQYNKTINDVELVGIAWPGPGHYSKGILTATFIPGCINKPVHNMLLEAFRKRFGNSVNHLNIVSCLDVNARAWGEILSPSGAFYAHEGSPKLSGLVLNIATGIAGAIVIDGYVLKTFGSLGETYGQWGRYIFYEESSKNWTWEATEDGSIPIHKGIRFTLLCGGPALAKRFYIKYSHSSINLPANLASALEAFPGVEAERNLEAEKTLLMEITKNAYSGDRITKDFVKTVGCEIGSAIKCLIDTFDGKIPTKKLLLTGGIGEFFGKPEISNVPDIFVDAIKAAISIPDMHITRSTLGLDAEFIGFS